MQAPTTTNRGQKDAHLKMLITIAAAITCVSVAVLPAVAEISRMVDDRNNPTRLLAVATRRPKPQPRK